MFVSSVWALIAMFYLSLGKINKARSSKQSEKKFIGSFRWTKSRLPICLSVLTSKGLHTHTPTHTHTHAHTLSISHTHFHSDIDIFGRTLHTFCLSMPVSASLYFFVSNRKKEDKANVWMHATVLYREMVMGTKKEKKNCCMQLCFNAMNTSLLFMLN